VAAPKGLVADELRNERGGVRVLLEVQARWARRNLHRANRVIVTSRYCAGIAQEARRPRRASPWCPSPSTGGWDRRFAEAARRPAHRRTALAVARMYPRKRLRICRGGRGAARESQAWRFAS
jgi:hypothetical protein